MDVKKLWINNEAKLYWSPTSFIRYRLTFIATLGTRFYYGDDSGLACLKQFFEDPCWCFFSISENLVLRLSTSVWKK